MAAELGKAKLDVLIVDDEKRIRTVLRLCLESLGCGVDEAPNAPTARAAQERRSYDVAFLDLRLGQDSGLDLLPALLGGNPSIEVVVITAFASIESAVRAIRQGARDYLPKPFTPVQVQLIVERIASRRSLERRVSALRAELGNLVPEIDLHTESPRMQKVLDLVARAAAHDAPVYLRGEKGTGRQALARRVHALSSGGNRPFVSIETSAPSVEQLREAAGLAQDGTLFLPEVAELPPDVQAELVPFFDAHPMEPRPALRIVAASDRDIAKLVNSGTFRADLFERLKTFEISVPPLRDRREDILRLARRFLAFFCKGAPVKTPELTLETEVALLNHAWPGNVGELRATMERAAILRTGTRIGPEALPEAITAVPGIAPYLGGEFTIENIEREHILRVLARSATQEEASRILGIDASTLWRKRKRYGA